MLQFLFKVSRPRFWMYSIGTYLIGIGAAHGLNEAATSYPLVWLWLLYFTFPANLFVYGLNDMADMDTDAFNAKKGTYEVKITSSQKKNISIAIALSCIVFLPVVFFSSIREQLCFLLFLICGFAYSLKPIRLKAIPFLDSISNGIWCALVGMMGYYAGGGNHIYLLPILAGVLWASIMHAYSAIPDIEADTKANIKTIATVLGASGTLWACGIGYVSIAVILAISGHSIHALLTIPYIILTALSFYFYKTKRNIFKVYKLYPYITYIIGPLVYICNVRF